MPYRLSGLFSKKIWLVLGAGAVRNRTYRRGRAVFCVSFVSIKFSANRPVSGLFSKKIWLVLDAGAVRYRTYRRGRTVSCASLVSIIFLARRPVS